MPTRDMSNIKVLSQQWNDNKVVDLGPSLSDQELQIVSTEAQNLRSSATIYNRSKSGIYRDGSMATPAHCTVSSGGPVLQNILKSKEYLMFLREITGNHRLIPVRCGFNFYTANDYMGVHRDSYKATVTLSFVVNPPVEPMGLAPHLKEKTNQELMSLLDTDYVFEKTHQTFLDLKINHIYIFDGYNIPHWRPVVPQSGGILANMCYFEL